MIKPPAGKQATGETANTASVLIVDDEELVRNLLVEALGMEGYQVDTALNGLEALDRLGDQSYDAIITDLAMPKMNGLELIRETNESYPDIPKIIITGAGTLENAIEAVRLGAYDYVKKPLNLGELSLLLNRAIGNRKLVLANREFQVQLEQSNQRLEQRVKERTRELKKSEEKFRGLFENANDAILVVNRRGRFRNCNQSARTMLGYTEDELMEMSLSDTIADYETIWPAIERQLLNRGSVSGLEHQMIRRGGDLIFVENSSTTRLSDKDSVVGYQMFLRDVTIRKHAETEIQRKKEQLERMNRLKDEFIAHLSHELLTPLVPLKGYFSIIRQNIDSPEIITSSVDAAQKDAGRLQRLLENLIDLSQYISGSAILKQLPLEINDPVRRAVEEIRDKAVQKEISIDLELAENLPPVFADQRKIQQIVLNLLSNAVKFTEIKGHIIVKTEQDTKDVLIKVIDSGIGICGEEVPHIFESFYQEDGSTRRKRGGIGIGLAMVKRLVELHCGQVQVHSESGKGSEFTVSLPLDPDPS